SDDALREREHVKTLFNQADMRLTPPRSRGPGTLSRPRTSVLRGIQDERMPDTAALSASLDARHGTSRRIRSRFFRRVPTQTGKNTSDEHDCRVCRTARGG